MLPPAQDEALELWPSDARRNGLGIPHNYAPRGITHVLNRNFKVSNSHEAGEGLNDVVLRSVLQVTRAPRWEPCGQSRSQASPSQGRPTRTVSTSSDSRKLLDIHSLAFAVWQIARRRASAASARSSSSSSSWG